MILKHKNIYKTLLKTNTRPPLGLPPAIRSIGNAKCGDEMPITIFVSLQVPGVLTIDDVVYNDSLGTSPFDGDNTTYLISVDGGITEYLAVIEDITGRIASFEICREGTTRVFAELSAGYVSDTEIGCGTPTDTYDVFLEMQDPLSLTSNDIAFINSISTIVFDGFSLAYALYIPSLNKKYNVYINSDGEINIVNICL